MEIRVWRFQNYRDCGYTCNPHKFEVPALRLPRKFPVIPCKHLQCKSKTNLAKFYLTIEIQHTFSGYWGPVLPGFEKKITSPSVYRDKSLSLIVTVQLGSTPCMSYSKCTTCKHVLSYVSIMVVDVLTFAWWSKLIEFLLFCLHFFKTTNVERKK